MGTFFKTKKLVKSSIGYTLCQLFVTDKGFFHLAPMKSKYEVLKAVKQFSMEVVTPEAIIYYSIR